MLPIVHNVLVRRRRQEENKHLKRQRRLLRSTSDPFGLPDLRFIELFRLDKETVQELINNLRPYLVAGRYVSAVDSSIKVFVALRFYATGCYQRSVGQDYHLGLSQTSVHRCIHEVTEAIDNHLSARYIKFPRTRLEINTNKERFMNKFHFPGVLGAVDCTHVAILKPHVEAHNFLNRKGYYSLNVQILCDSELRILNINANYPGSTHDSFIWRQSQIRAFLNNIHFAHHASWLIGDSGYPLEPFLMTPFLNPEEGSPEARYNLRHAIARNCVERCIGCLKTRFRCLLKERTARYSPTFVGSLVNTCATLHNICVINNIPLLGEEMKEPREPQDYEQGVFQENMLNEGRRLRHNIVQRYFM